MPTPTQPNVPSSQRDAEPDTLETNRMWEFSDCLAERYGDRVDRLLATEPRSEEAVDAVAYLIRRRVSSRCLGDAGYPDSGLAIDRRRFRGSLSQARYLIRYPDGMPSAIAGAPLEQITAEAFNARMIETDNPIDESIRVFADCVVANNATVVDLLVRTEFASVLEMEAITAIVPIMGPCLWEGRTIAFTRETLRAALAAGLYREAEMIGAEATSAEAAE